MGVKSVISVASPNTRRDEVFELTTIFLREVKSPQAMAAVDVTARGDPPINDDLDDLFNFDVPGDLYKDVDTNMDIASAQPPSSTNARKNVDDTLGLDTEIKAKKQRQPIAKLDENRLLSQAGIPKLRRITKERVKFKGKGHEFSDIARLLNVYQLWLDDLYPRAKFVDGLAIIEKLGHSKRMQVIRKEWINEGKARDTTRVGDVEKEERSTSQQRAGQESETRKSGGVVDGDAGTSLREGEGMKKPAFGGSADESLFMSDEEGAGEEDVGDDLDAILAEEDARRDAVPL